MLHVFILCLCVCELLHVPSTMFLHEKVNKYMHIIILYIFYYINLFMHTVYCIIFFY